MTLRSQDITLDPSAAVSPNIFDVLGNSTLVAPILLANLLSADLWLLSEKIRSKYLATKSALEPAPVPIPEAAGKAASSDCSINGGFPVAVGIKLEKRETPLR